MNLGKRNSPPMYLGTQNLYSTPCFVYPTHAIAGNIERAFDREHDHRKHLSIFLAGVWWTTHLFMRMVP